MTAPPSWLKDYTKTEIRSGLDKVRHPIEVAVYGVDNYFNFGAIIRVCHNFLVKRIYAVETDGYYKKASMGARKYEDIVKMTLQEFPTASQGRSLVVMERRPGLESEDLTGLVWPRNPIVFFGGEKFGVPQEILDIADHVVSIPVYGILNDHNVAVATGITLYDWSKKHREGPELAWGTP